MTNVGKKSHIPIELDIKMTLVKKGFQRKLRPLLNASFVENNNQGKKGILKLATDNY